MVADRKPYHRACLKCERCKKTLTPANINTMVEEVKIYCQTCYNDAVVATLVRNYVFSYEKNSFSIQL